MSPAKTKKERQGGNPDVPTTQTTQATVYHQEASHRQAQDLANPSIKEGEPGELHVADKVYTFIRRFISLTDAQASIIALWVLHTHCFDAAQVTPYLSISSAEKRCGKSTLLLVLKLLVAKPWKTGAVSTSVLFRKIDAVRPTFLFDETDATFGGDKEFAEGLRGVLNLGYEIEGAVSRSVGQDFTSKDFSVFCPKAFAGIGKLPDTVADRSFPIHLKRKSRGERVERFRRREAVPQGAELKSDVETWLASVSIDGLAAAIPELPDELDDRQQDVAEPLLAIADLIGNPWATKLRRALVEVCTSGRDTSSSQGTLLLEDIRNILDDRGVERISSWDLVQALCEIETSQWGELSKGRPMTSITMARILKGYGVAPHNVRIGEAILKGYDRADLEDAWERYAPAQVDTQPATPPQTGVSATKYSSYPSEASRYMDVPVAPSKREIANASAGCSVVAAQTPDMEGEGDEEVNLSDIWPAESRPPGVKTDGVTCDKCLGWFATNAGRKAHIAQGRCVATEVGR